MVWAAQPALMPGPDGNFYPIPSGMFMQAPMLAPAPAPAPAPKQQEGMPAGHLDQFWCEELDGSYTLRTGKEIAADLQPGRWAFTDEGNAYWVRKEKK